jgi:hypothetical protein
MIRPEPHQSTPLEWIKLFFALDPTGARIEYAQLQNMEVKWKNF